MGELPRRARCAQGAIPENDPRLLTRAILGLYNSIWHWYRPNGIVALTASRRSSPTAALALIGLRAGGDRARRAAA